jgi:hypothetical protein
MLHLIQEGRRIVIGRRADRIPTDAVYSYTTEMTAASSLLAKFDFLDIRQTGTSFCMDAK